MIKNCVSRLYGSYMVVLSVGKRIGLCNLNVRNSFDILFIDQHWRLRRVRWEVVGND